MARQLAVLLAVAPWLVAFGPYRPAALGASSLGMADAQVATSVGVAALVANPANMAANQQQVLEFGGARDTRAGADGLHVGVVDATSSWGLTAGIAYQRNVDWTFERPLRTGHDLRAGVAVGVNNEAGRLTLGASARWLALDVPGATGSRTLGGWTGDAGLSASIYRFRLGGTVRNLAVGRVELVAEGGRGELEDFLAAVKDSGLRRFIGSVELNWEEPDGKFRGFEIVA